ncbi:MAG: PQQ-dependent sugar dehydrogenase [Planctomycetes bacterium]|nr:PQQ-dependent sugar dehydrogenase [Planctomycetota bacterium]
MRIDLDDADLGSKQGIEPPRNGDTVLIGSPGHSDERGGAGAAYVYRFGQMEHDWLEVSELTWDETEFGDDFGVAVAVHGAFAFVGAPGDDGVGLDTGAVYAFRILGMTDCNENGVDDACEHGCNGNGIPDDCDIANGTSADCNGNGIPDECEPDCNGNGSPDDCDIDSGKADDLNGNGLPDSCEDCNGNGFPDQWDVLNGTSEDANGNGIPDECDPPETGIRLAVVAVGLVQPLLVTHAPSDFERVFIVEKAGRIRVLKGGQLLEEPFLDLSRIVQTLAESGLLGLAFPPDYVCNGDFYVNYSNTIGDTVIARYRVSENPDIAEPDGEVLLTIEQTDWNHNGGCLAFGGDGFLYVGMGDGGGDSRDAQDLSKLLGKMLRIDVDVPKGYAIPPDNPFVNDADIRDEIWAVGLRNPWRFSFDRQTGDMYIGDVGGEYEEIGFEPGGSPGGRNHGWPCMSGFSGGCLGCCACGMFTLTPPIFDYMKGPDEEAVIGGHVYRGCAIPDLTGTYIFADLERKVWSFRFDGETLTDFRERTESLTPSGEPLGFITSFGEDADGELYMCEFQAGRVLKFVPYATTGDFDLDGDVDASDFALMRECLAGPDPSALDPCCRRFDFDLDADVDLADVAKFWAAMTDP